MDSVIEEIKQRLDIVEVIGSYIKLEKVGANYRAVCPFHSEKKPSFFVSPSRQIWHCFGCGRGGDIFKFIMEIEKVEFGDALRILAKRAGVELKPQNPALQTARKRLYDICELATKFFEKQLHSTKKGSRVIDYLKKRGLKEETIYEWRLGYAPDVKGALLDFLKSKGFKEDEIIKTGLAIKGESGTVFDRFRSRIMFPIFDLNSQVIGFGGRIFERDDVAKYMNIPNTLLYDKSKTLYGLNKSKMFIRQEDKCVLVEGYMDVLMSYQAGVKNVVAVSGTALTPYHLRILKRYTNNLVTSFDMDLAGNSATKRGIDLAQKEEFNVRVVVMPEGLDPADVASQHPEDWKNLVDSAKSIGEFYFETAFSNFDARTVEGKKKISETLLPFIANIPNKIEQSYWIKELAKKLEVSEESIEEEIKRRKKKEELLMEEDKTNKEDESLDLPKSREELLEERIFAAVLFLPELLEKIENGFKEIFSEKGKKLLNVFLEEKDKFTKDPLSLKLEDELKEYFDYLWLKKDLEESFKENESLIADFETSLKELRKIFIKNRLEEISQEIKKAEVEKNPDKEKELIESFNRYSQELLKLNQ